MNIDIVSVLIATVVQFIIGFIWYGPLFGSLWGKIHGFDKLSKETQAKMMKEMGPYYGAQLVVTVITSVFLSILLDSVSLWNPYLLALSLWLGFVVPTQVSGVIFGGTEQKWIMKKILVQSGASLFCLLAASIVFSMM